MVNTLHIGTVVGNADYADTANGQYLGRVLVMIPGLTLTSKSKQSRSHKALGTNTEGSLNSKMIQEVEHFEKIWAYVMAPIAGESSMGKYNRTLDSSSLADGNDMSNFVGTNYTSPPASMFASQSLDGHSGGPAVNMTSKVNPYGNCYITENYNDSGKGMFSLPSVNSKVIVGFLNGSRGIPIVIGKIHSGTEIEQIYGVGNAYPDYPNVFENTVAPTTKPPTSNTVTVGNSNELPVQYRATAEELETIRKAQLPYKATGATGATSGYDFENSDLMPITKWLGKQGVFG